MSGGRLASRGEPRSANSSRRQLESRPAAEDDLHARCTILFRSPALDGFMIRLSIRVSADHPSGGESASSMSTSLYRGTPA